MISIRDHKKQSPATALAESAEAGEKERERASENVESTPALLRRCSTKTLSFMKGCLLANVLLIVIAFLSARELIPSGHYSFC